MSSKTKISQPVIAVDVYYRVSSGPRGEFVGTSYQVVVNEAKLTEKSKKNEKLMGWPRMYAFGSELFRKVEVADGEYTLEACKGSGAKRPQMNEELIMIKEEKWFTQGINKSWEWRQANPDRQGEFTPGEIIPFPANPSITQVREGITRARDLDQSVIEKKAEWKSQDQAQIAELIVVCRKLAYYYWKAREALGEAQVLSAFDYELKGNPWVNEKIIEFLELSVSTEGITVKAKPEDDSDWEADMETILDND